MWMDGDPIYPCLQPGELVALLRGEEREPKMVYESNAVLSLPISDKPAPGQGGKV